MGLIEDAKSLGQLAKRVSELELRNEFNSKIAEVTAGLLEMQQRVIELQEENAQLREQARQSAQIDGLTCDRGVYWPPEPNHTNGPAYCTACLGDRGKTIVLQKLDEGYARCPSCKFTFREVFDHEPTKGPVPRVISRRSDILSI